MKRLNFAGHARRTLLVYRNQFAQGLPLRRVLRTTSCGVFVLVASLFVTRGNAQTISAEAMLPAQREAAEQYRIYTDSSRERMLELQSQPIFVWTNPRRSRGQVGHLFYWTDGEYPGALGTIFSFPWQGKPESQRLVHELHSLMESTIAVDNHQASTAWQPTGGIEFLPLPEAGEVPAATKRRELRMRQLSRRFEAHTIDPQQQTWPLRILGKELVTYRGPDREGGLFAMLGDAGADPELLLLIEAHRSDGEWSWRCAPVRMTDHEIQLAFAGREFWQSLHDEANTSFHDAKKTYFRFPDKLFDASELVETQ